MKKLKYLIVLICYFALLGIPSVNAQIIKAEDVPNRTYIIGNHMFTREANEKYDGRLTTKHIMLGASTQETGNLEEMIIYYKNPQGKWKDGLTNRDITPPETFEILNKDLVELSQTYKITYELDGGIVSNPEEYKDSSPTFTLNNPTKEGYIFIGWTGSNGEEPELEVTIEKGTTGNLEYKANWKPEIAYGDANETGEIENNDYLLIQQYVLSQKGQLIENPITGPFNKLNADVNADGIITDADAVLILKYLNGKYKDENGEEIFNLPEEPLKNSYTIHYSVDSNDNYYVDYEIENFKTDRPDAPIKEGYTFAGWYKDPECQTEYDFDTPITSNKTLYAKFDKKIIYYGDANGDNDVTPSDAYDILFHIKGKYVNDFNMLNADINGDGKITYLDSVLTLRYVAEYYDNLYPTLLENPLTTHTIKYMVEVEGTTTKEYNMENIGYIVKGYSIKEQGLYYDENNDINFSNGIYTPIKEGYSFVRWYEDPDYQIPYNFDKPVTSDLTLYTKYNIEEIYTITYELDGGTVSNPTSYTPLTKDFVLNNPTRDGYKFMGWTGSNGDTPELEVTIEEGTIGDLEYKANWVKVYNVSFYDFDEKIIGQPQEVIAGESALAPGNPYINDYMFTGWDQDYTNVTSDLNIYSTFEENTTCFTSSEGKITDYDEKACGTNVTIPNKIEGVDITELSANSFSDKGITTLDLNHATNLELIGNEAFIDNNITGTLVIPSSLKFIEAKAFSAKKGNNKIDVLDITHATNLIEIGNEAFYQNSLTELYIPSSLQILGTNAFYGNEIESVNFDDAKHLYNIDGFAYNKIKEVDLNKATAVQGIDISAFEGNPITTLKFEQLESLIYIEENAFSGCDLTTVETPSGTIRIETGAFRKSTTSNKNLTTIINNTTATNWKEIIGGSSYTGGTTGIVTVDIGDVEIK